MNEGPLHERIGRFADRLEALGGEVVERSAERCRGRWEVDGAVITAEAAARERGAHGAVYTLSTTLQRAASATGPSGYRSPSERPIELLPTVVLGARTTVARALARLGVGRSVRTGDDAFDADVVIDTTLGADDIQNLVGSIEVRAAVRELFDLGVTEVSLNGQDGELGSRWWRDAERVDLSAVAKAFARLAKHLPPVVRLGPKALAAEKRPAGSAPGIIAPIVLLLATQVMSCGTQRLDDGLATDLSWGGLAALVTIAVAWLITRGRAHARPHFLAMVLIGAPCMGFAVAELVFALNVLLDQPVQREALVRRAYATDDDYRLEIAEAPFTSRPATIEVFRSVHGAVGERTDVRVTLTVGPGRWGRPWVRGGSTKVAPAE